ncbi:hypothetical protein HN992_01080 [Candidatus Woesearchaeota archaeon]|nr:hypothetical protein [Candidatus Woesearchaeota archaeon]MBT3438780.1 hypothetical protein [Candidatus Woesearchaeota archaeon]MBT4057991.1 hypothetical protein [Candidatus Woesearchaeota archaeon]MBT4208733.1 hypothetical protein [Candidatus Woesearchaeota archaeon]MBT4733177.1 hypothetical protein [Candidatus Woesearchaeota archaeon]
MTIKKPKSMDECIYFTIRSKGKGKTKAWVFKKECPECKKELMGKPRDPKTGRPKIRSKEYLCPACKFTEEKIEHEESLNACIIYTCPSCVHEGEIEIPYKRKSVGIVNEETGKKTYAKALQFECEKCEEKINVTKKMKGN